MLTFAETCARLGLESSAVYKRIRLGLLVPMKHGHKNYFAAEAVEHLASYSLTLPTVMKRLRMGRREILAWVKNGNLPALKIGAIFHFKPADIDTVAAQIQRYNLLVTEAARRYHLSIHLLLNSIERGVISSLRVPPFCYVDSKEVADLALTSGGFSIGQVAKRLGLSVDQVDGLVKREVLSCTSTPGGDRRFHEADIRLYETERKQRR